jgi:hypothetical protein
MGGVMRPTIGWLTAGLLISVNGWASAITLGTFPVNPQSTFLYQSSNDNNIAALFINLTGCTGPMRRHKVRRRAR